MGMVLMAQGKGIIGLQGLSELEQAGATIPTDDGTKTKKDYILKPRKWQVDVDILGDPTDGSDIPSKWTFHEEGEEESQLSAAIELEAGGNSAGSYGPLNFSAEIKAKTGISWMKTVKTQYAHDTTIDETKLYVPIPTRAKLMSDVISAYNTSFALFWGA
ncbi:hypothetical protein BDV23DRAFT_179078 [Aspergillus alliaceus]|uniref:Uncharacterized protein n=1 Tax=Petromyces alliaceus TaxID=209559 RepID=A0A5N7CLI0_PETAA|nr:hypothetical protein BDV23DRAFT_179078 [Aspergillus alliaceus]